MRCFKPLYLQVILYGNAHLVMPELILHCHYNWAHLKYVAVMLMNIENGCHSLKKYPVWETNPIPLACLSSVLHEDMLLHVKNTLTLQCTCITWDFHQAMTTLIKCHHDLCIGNMHGNSKMFAGIGL